MVKNELFMAHRHVAPQAPRNAAVPWPVFPVGPGPMPCCQHGARLVSSVPHWQGVSILSRSSRMHSFNMQEPVTVLNPSDVLHRSGAFDLRSLSLSWCF